VSLTSQQANHQVLSALFGVETVRKTWFENMVGEEVGFHRDIDDDNNQTLTLGVLRSKPRPFRLLYQTARDSDGQKGH
jgi:hypothetical protein